MSLTSLHIGRYKSLRDFCLSLDGHSSIDPLTVPGYWAASEYYGATTLQ